MTLRLARLAVLLVLSSSLFADEPWDAPPFSAEPQALLAAAAKVPQGDVGVVVLLDEATYSFEADGSQRTVSRLMYRIDEQSAVETNSQISAEWAPWHHDKPVLAARVVTKDGTVHVLDAKAVTEAPARDSSLDIFSDNRIVRAPLPAVAVGSVVEYTITTDGRTPIEGAGIASYFPFGQWVPVHRMRLVLDGPLSIQPRILNDAGIEPVIEDKDGRRRMTFASGPAKKLENVESYLPFDQLGIPYVAFSTGTSWQHIATGYAKIVDQQIAGSDLAKLVKSATAGAKTPHEITARLLAAIQKDIRYAGVEIAEGSIIPRTPATVLKNKYGDCKDKAVLLVAMLRQAGLTAHVALLRSGYDLDAHETLPGLTRFNHAIVRVDTPDGAIWVDPTDQFARAGELPIADQGRLALIASESTTALARTPELPSTAFRYTETRLFNLGEHGKPPVVEITEIAGPYDASQRRWIVNTAADELKKDLEGYAKSYYFAKALDSFTTSDMHDLTKPFRLTLNIKESGSGIVSNGEASVALHPGGLVNSLPSVLRDWKEPQPDDDPDDAPKPRVHDFVFPQPLVKEWTYRIVPPIGYVARELPEAQNRKLGTATYTSEYNVEADGVVVAKLRVDSGKRRITAAEYEATRVAISKLIQEPQVNIGFEQIGQAKLAAGDVGGALAEFRRLAQLHPKEAQHRIELANALLAGGLAEPAREEARRAIALEPANARAHLTLAQILQHDLLGRRFYKGWDRPGTIAALRKAKELDPENMDVRVYLAQTLKIGEDGYTGSAAQLAEAEAEYRALSKDFGDDGRAYEGELMMVLAHLGKFAELKELAMTVTDAQRRNVGRLIAIAAGESKDEALRELRMFPIDTRRTYAEQLGNHLLEIRRYAEAAAMMEVAKQGTAEASGAAVFIEMMKNARRAEELELRDDDPTTIVPRLFKVMMHGDTASLLNLLVPDLRDEARQELEAKGGNDPLETLRGTLRNEEFVPKVIADIVIAMVQAHKDGNDDVGYRIRSRLADESMVAYVTKEGDKYLMRAFEGDESVGKAALRFVEKNQIEHARTWLNWGRETASAGDGDDPLSRSAFAMLWPKAKPTATADEARVAAAAFAVESATKKDARIQRQLDLLASLREQAESDAVKLAIDLALTRAWSTRREFAKVLPHAQRLYDAHPDSATAFRYLGDALASTGRHDEADAIARARLEKIPNDRDALAVLADNAASRGDYAGAVKYAQRLLDEHKPSPGDFNNAAWYGLFAGDIEAALKHASQATSDAEKANAAAFHTLASIYAEADKPIEARQALLTSMKLGARDQPESDDWYVLGRIAETYGVRDAAAAAYKRVSKPNEKDDAHTFNLVARRVAKLK